MGIGAIITCLFLFGTLSCLAAFLCTALGFIVSIFGLLLVLAALVLDFAVFVAGPSLRFLELTIFSLSAVFLVVAFISLAIAFLVWFLTPLASIFWAGEAAEA